MKKLLLAALTLGAATVSAQPVVNNLFPTSPGTFNSVLTQADTAGVVPGPAGANQTWNFTLVYTDTVQQFGGEYVDPSTTPFAADFPTANLATTFADSGVAAYSYFLSTPSLYSSLGFAFTDDMFEIVNVYSDPQDIFFPITYASNQNDTYYGSYTMAQPGFELVNESFGVTSWTYDAYGTLTINGTSFNNVVRLHSTSIDTALNSVIITGLDTTETMTFSESESYMWVNPATNEFLLNIQYYESTDDVGTVTTGMSVYAIETLPTSVAAVSGNAFDIALAPNVTDRGSFLTVNNDGNYTVTVVDMLGKTVSESKLNGKSIYLNTADFASGMYIVRVQNAAGESQTEKLMVK